MYCTVTASLVTNTVSRDELQQIKLYELEYLCHKILRDGHDLIFL